MNYVMSDIHGQFNMFMEMLEKIGFRDNDELYILGDIVGLGDKSFECVDFVMDKENIHCLLGDYDLNLYKRRKKRSKYIHDDDHIYRIWGRECDEETANKYSSWMQGLPFQQKLIMNDKTYYLNHAWPMTIQENKDVTTLIKTLYVPVGEYYKYAHKTFCEDRVYITGHIETYKLWEYENIESNKIWFNKNKSFIDIDCGAGYIENGGCLGCLRLNDMQEFYVKR